MSPRRRPILKLVQERVPVSHGDGELTDSGLLARIISEGVVQGDSEVLLPRLPRESVDLFFTSPPYADARAYSLIHPDRYVDWFLPFARAMYDAAKPSVVRQSVLHLSSDGSQCRFGARDLGQDV